MKIYKFCFLIVLLVSISKECELPCLSCTGYICEKCNEGFFLNAYAKCQSCDLSCSKCESSTVCTVCRKGHYLNSTTCEFQNIPPEGLTLFLAQMIILAFLLTIAIGCLIENIRRIVLIRKYKSDLRFYNSKEIAGLEQNSKKTEDIESNEDINFKVEKSLEKLEIAIENMSSVTKKKDVNSLSPVLEEPYCEKLKETEGNNLEIDKKLENKRMITSDLKK